MPLQTQNQHAFFSFHAQTILEREQGQNHQEYLYHM